MCRLCSSLNYLKIPSCRMHANVRKQQASRMRGNIPPRWWKRKNKTTCYEQGLGDPNVQIEIADHGMVPKREVIYIEAFQPWWTPAGGQPKRCEYRTSQ